MNSVPLNDASGHVQVPGTASGTLPTTHARAGLISIVVPCFNEEEVFAFLQESLVHLSDHVTATMACGIEIILVDDGSKDSTWTRIVSAVKSDSRFEGVRLSRNFGQQAALTCGYSVAKGDAVVTIDADLQDPPEVIIQMIEKWRAGADVVYGIRIDREGETAFKLWTASIFYRLLRFITSADISAASGDFRLVSRRALSAIAAMGEKHRFLRGMVGWIGFNVDRVEYHRKRRAAGKTKYSLRKMATLAADAIFSFSTAPLRFAYYAAVVLFIAFGSSASLSMGDSSGNLSNRILLAAIVSFGSCILLSQALLGEYIGRIYEESKRRPLYLVQDTTTSTVVVPVIGADRCCDKTSP